MDLLGPGHGATADHGTLEGALEAQHLRSILPPSHVEVHCKFTIAMTAHLVDALALFTRIQQTLLLFEHLIFPWLGRVHTLGEGANVVLVAQKANTQILQAQFLAHKQTRHRLKNILVIAIHHHLLLRNDDDGVGNYTIRHRHITVHGLGSRGGGDWRLVGRWRSRVRVG